jgi:hypothetical protein
MHERSPETSVGQNNEMTLSPLLLGAGCLAKVGQIKALPARQLADMALR